MSALPIRKPFLPSDLPRSKPGSAVGKAALVAARHSFRFRDDASTSLEQVCARTYPNDSQVPRLVSKGAVNPASTTGSGWADSLAHTVTGDFVASMTGQSAAARLIDAGVKLTFDNNRAAAIAIPARAAAPSADVQWVAENAPMPVLSFTLSALTLTPHK
jgi:hypothetical protein